MKGMASHKAENETRLTWADFGLDNYHELPKSTPKERVWQCQGGKYAPRAQKGSQGSNSPGLQSSSFATLPSSRQGPRTLATCYYYTRYLWLPGVCRQLKTWIFIGRTVAETEAPTLWSPDVKSQLTEKNLEVGKVWGQEEKGAKENAMVRWPQWLNDMNF